MEQNNPQMNGFESANHNTRRPATIAAMVFLLLLLLIGLFLFGMRLNQEQSAIIVEDFTDESSSNDDLNVIQTDLEEFNLEELEIDSADIDTTLDSELES